MLLYISEVIKHVKWIQKCKCNVNNSLTGCYRTQKAAQERWMCCLCWCLQNLLTVQKKLDLSLSRKSSQTPTDNLTISWSLNILIHHTQPEAERQRMFHLKLIDHLKPPAVVRGQFSDTATLYDCFCWCFSQIYQVWLLSGCSWMSLSSYCLRW